MKRILFNRASLRAAPAPGQASNVVGIVAMIAGVSAASLQAGLSKYLVSDMPALLIVWWRMLGILVILLPFAVTRHRRLLLSPPRPLIQMLRGCLLLLASVCFVTATEHIALTDAIAVAFVYPFLITLMAPWILGERVGLLNWLAVTAGFIGVLIVMRPSLSGIDVNYLLALVAGIAYAAVLVISRLLAGPSPTFVTASWTAATALVLLSIKLPTVWISPAPVELALLTLVGLFAAFSQILVVYACARAPMSTLAPFGYVEIISATVIGVLLFGDFPDAISWTGIGVIVVSGLVVALGAGRSVARTPDKSSEA